MKASIARAWQAWMELAPAIGNFQARVLLTLVYFIWLLPFGLVARLFTDPLDARGRGRPPAATGWKKRGASAHTMQALRSQF